MAYREDVWSHDTCLVCQSKHSTTEEKEQHEKEQVHKSRTVVYDFLNKELSCQVPSSSESILYERYYRANTSVAGLDCICELNFSWSKTPFWACTICYIAGKTLESADTHLYSSYHKRNYISEYHPERFSELVRAQEKSAQDKLSMIEHDAILDILYEAKGLSPPDVYILSDRSKSWALQKLGLTDEETKADYIVEPISDSHQIVECHICGESFLAYEKEELMQKAWNVHLSTNVHQRSAFMQSLLQEAKLRDAEGLPPYCNIVSPLVTDLTGFTKVIAAFYGKSCGFEFLVDFKGSNHSFCSICFCVLSNNDITDHFASEYHIARCVKRSSPSKLLNSEYMSVDERQQILLEYLQDTKNANGKEIRHKTCDVPLPLLLKRFSFPDKRAFESNKVEETMIGTFKAVWCEDCKQYIKLAVQEWHEHIFDDDHFENATKRVLCYIDNNLLVSRSAAKALPPFKKSTIMIRFRDGATQGWYEKFSHTLGLTLAQDNCYFGSQYVVKDELNRQITCLCCYFVCSYEEDDTMCLHVRSMNHINRALNVPEQFQHFPPNLKNAKIVLEHSRRHMVNKNLVGILWKYRNLNMEKTFLWDYLTHCNLDSRNDAVMVFDPVMACTANCFGLVPAKLIDIANAAPEFRQAVAESRHADNTSMPLNIAFRICNVEVKAVENEYVVLYCQECHQSFASSFGKVNEKFAEHILSQSHFKRKTILNENACDDNKRAAHISSSFEVSPFQQPSDKKKVTWKWNEVRKVFEFVYAQLGLSEIVERRNFVKDPSKRDMFCKLCAESIKAKKIDLEHHIRSFTHIFYYVHKNRPQAIPDLETYLIDENVDNFTRHKNIRKLFQRSLKGLDKEKGDVPIFDFSLKFCESDEVKNILQDEPEPMQIVDNRPQIQAVMAIYANKLKPTNPAEIQKFVEDVMQKSSPGFCGKDWILDDAKHKLLQVDFSGFVEVSEKDSEKDDSATSAPALLVQESAARGQRPEIRGPQAEPGRDARSRKSRSRSNSRTRSRKLKSKTPPRYVVDERTRAIVRRRSRSSSRTRRARSGSRTRTTRRSRSTSKSRSKRSKSKEKSPPPAKSVPRRSKTVMKPRIESERPRSPSPTYKKFHGLPDKPSTFDYSARPAFNSYHARTSELIQKVNIPPSEAIGVARFGGPPIFEHGRPVVPDLRSPEPRFQLAYIREGISPERGPRPIELAPSPHRFKDTDSKDKENRGSSPSRRSHRRSKSKSPVRKRSKSKSPVRKRSKSPARRRSRTPTSRRKSRSKSPSRKRSKSPSRKRSKSPTSSRTLTPVVYESGAFVKSSNGRKRSRSRSRSRDKDKTSSRSRDHDRKRSRKSRSRSRSRRSRSRSPSQRSSTRHRDGSRDRSRRKSRSTSHSGSRSKNGRDKSRDKSRSGSRSSDNEIIAAPNPILEQNLMNRLKKSAANKIQINLPANSIKELEKDAPQTYRIRNAPKTARVVKSEADPEPSISAQDIARSIEARSSTRWNMDKEMSSAKIPPPTNVIPPPPANLILNPAPPNRIVLTGADKTPASVEAFRQKFLMETGIDINAAMAPVTTAAKTETTSPQPVTSSTPTDSTLQDHNKAISDLLAQAAGRNPSPVVSSSAPVGQAITSVTPSGQTNLLQSGLSQPTLAQPTSGLSQSGSLQGNLVLPNMSQPPPISQADRIPAIGYSQPGLTQSGLSHSGSLQGNLPLPNFSQPPPMSQPIQNQAMGFSQNFVNQLVQNPGLAAQLAQNPSLLQSLIGGLPPQAQASAAASLMPTIQVSGLPPLSLNPALMPFGNMQQQAFGGPPTMPFGIPTNVPPPSTSMVFSAPPPIQQPVIDKTELIMRAKMELFKKDLIDLKNVTDLIEYLWKQGYDKIPNEDPPLLFNEVVKQRRGMLGAATLYQIICYGHPELETYYCGMCNHWTTVSEMFLHLKAPMHRLNYMFRNYKMYHTKALNEPDEVVRDVLLDKFADKIWDLEGSGHCSHRMRCILNQEAIARLWPEYKDCIDNSWKIMDFDDDSPPRYDTRPLSRASTGSNHSRPRQRSTPGLYGQSKGPISVSGVEDPISFPQPRSPSRSPERESGRLSGRQPEESRVQRRERSLSRYSRSRTRSRSPSHDRDHKRRSRDEDRRKEPSRSKSPGGKSASKDAKLDSWDAKVAAFLYKNGDREGAMKLYVSSIQEQETRIQDQDSRMREQESARIQHQESQIQDKANESRTQDQDNEPPSPAYESFGTSESDSSPSQKTPTQPKTTSSTSFEDRLRGMAPRDSLGAREKARLLAELEKPKPVSAARPEDTGRTASPQKIVSRSAARNAAQAQAMDDATIRRKAVGAMVQLQSMADAEGGTVSNETFFKVCEEVGLPPEEIFTNQLLHQSISYFTTITDVRSAYQEYIAAKEAAMAPPQPMVPTPTQQSEEPTTSVASNFRNIGLTAQEMMNILSKINSGGQSQPAPVVPDKPEFRPTGEYAEPELSEEVSYVYPGYDEEDSGKSTERDPSEIEAQVNRLTFAFGSKKSMKRHLAAANAAARPPVASHHPPVSQEMHGGNRPLNPMLAGHSRSMSMEQDLDYYEGDERYEMDPEMGMDAYGYERRYQGHPPAMPPMSSMYDPQAAHLPPGWPRNHRGPVPPPSGPSRMPPPAPPQPPKPSTKKPNPNLEPLGSPRVFGKPPGPLGSEGRSEAGPSSRHGGLSYPEADSMPNPKRMCEEMIKKAAQKGYPMGMGPPKVPAQPKRQENPENQSPPPKKKGYPMGLSAKNAHNFILPKILEPMPPPPRPNIDFTSDDWDDARMTGSIPRSAANLNTAPPPPPPTEPPTPHDYYYMAQQIGDDWSSIESQIDDMLKPKARK